MEEMNINHAIERSKERLNQNSKQAMRQIKLALERGKSAKDCTGSIEKKFLLDRCNISAYAVAYNGCCYIFENRTDRVVTVYSLPGWWGKKKHYKGKERIRKAKTYYRLNNADCMAV